ncbi:MAG: hypothetical protein ACREJ5_23260 [Geminicoccaceae bacterium]
MRLHLTGHVIDELSERGLERQSVERVATDPNGSSRRAREPAWISGLVGSPRQTGRYCE